MYNRFKTFFLGCIIAGVLQVIIGFVFLIRAGIPYQDPNVEMVIEWTTYNMAGTYVTNCGLATLGVGVVGLVLTLILGRNRKNENQRVNIKPGSSSE